MKRINKRLISVMLSAVTAIGMITVPVRQAEAAAENGIYEGFSGFAPGQLPFVMNTTTWCRNTDVGKIYAATWSDPYDAVSNPGGLGTEIVNKNTLDPTKNGKMILNFFIGNQGISYTADMNVPLEKGDIFTISFDWYENIRSNYHFFQVFINNGFNRNYQQGGSTYSYKSLMHNDQKNNTNVVMRCQNCIYPFGAECGYVISGQTNDFARYDIVVNTCDDSHNGEQTATFYRDGEVIEKGIFYETGKTTPLDKITRVGWYLEGVKDSHKVGIDNIFIQKTGIADKKRSGVIAKLDGSARTVNFASGNASANSSGNSVNFLTAADGEYAVSYKSIAETDGSGAINVGTIADNAYVIADLSLPDNANAADYYVVLASRPEADNGNNASASGVKLSKYINETGKVKIPLSAFTERNFVNGSSEYQKLDEKFIAGVGIAYAPGTPGEGSITLNDIYIVCDVKGPTDLRVADITPGCVSLAWMPSENTVAAYELYRDGVKVADLEGTADSYMDSGLALNNSYSYKLRTKTTYGEYLPDLEINDVYVSVVGKPASFSASNIGGEELSVKLEWTAAEYGTAAGYVLSRDGVQIAETDGDTFTYIDKSGLSDNVNYTYTVCAKAEDGTYSVERSAGVTAAYLYAPENVVYSGGTLSWNPSQNADKYEVYQNGVMIAETGDASYVFSETPAYGDIYTFSVIAKTAGGRKSRESNNVFTYLIDPMLSQTKAFYRGGLQDGISVNTINAEADALCTENTAMYDKAIKVKFNAARKNTFTVASNSFIGAQNNADSGRIVFSVYIPKNVDLNKYSVGLSYEPGGANTTPAIATVPLAGYIKEKGRWTVAQIPISALPKTVVYTQNGREIETDTDLRLITGISITADFSTSADSEVIYVDDIFIGNFGSQSASILDKNGISLSGAELPTNDKYILLYHAAGIDAASVKSGSFSLTSENGTDVLLSAVPSETGVKLNILSSLEPNMQYNLSLSGIKDKNGAVLPQNYTFRTNSDAAQAKETAKADILGIDANDVTVGGAVNMKISLSDPKLSSTDAQNSELYIDYDTNILGVVRENISAENAQTEITGNRITIKQNTLPIGNNTVCISFSTKSVGSGIVTVSGKFVTGGNIPVEITPSVKSVRVNAVASSGGGGSGGYSGGRDMSNIAQTPQPTHTPAVNESEFTDVGKDYWAYEYIKKLADNKIISGYPGGIFNPEGEVRREEFAVMLANAFDLGSEQGEGFNDIDTKAWYAKAILAAQKRGIISGINSESFGLGETITREDMCVMIRRLAEVTKLKLSEKYDKIIFTDADAISDYALEAVTDLQVSGIISGYGDGSFMPKGKVTRAAAAKVIASVLSEAEGVTVKAPEVKQTDKEEKNELQVSEKNYSKAAKKLKAFGIYIPGEKVSAEMFIRSLAGALGENVALEDTRIWAEIKGILDSGMFAEEISYGTALTAIIKAMGLSAAAESLGGGVNGAYKAADSLKITQNIKIGLDQTMEPETVCLLIANLLDAKMPANEYRADGISVMQGDETVMEKFLKVRKISVNVTDINKKERSIAVREIGNPLTYATTPDFDFDSIAPTNCVIYINDDGRVFYCEIKGDAEVFYDYIKMVNGSDADSSYDAKQIRSIKFANRNKECKTADNAVIYYNEQKTRDNDMHKYIDRFARVILIDGSIAYAEVYDLYDGGLIYATDEDFIKFTQGTSNQNVLRGLSDVDNIMVVLDGTVTGGVDLLDEKMVFDYWVDDVQNNMIIAASTRKAYGKLETVRDEIRIDGKDYRISANVYYYDTYLKRYTADSAYGKYIGEKVTAYIDDRSEIRYVLPDEEETSTSTVYGVIKKVIETNGDAENDYEIRIIPILGAGSGNDEMTYKVRKNLPKDSLSIEYVQGVQSDYDGNGFLKFTLNENDEIKKIEFVENFGKRVPFNTPDYSLDEKSYFFSGLYLKYARMFCIYRGPDGFSVKFTNWEDMRQRWFKNGDRSKDIFLTTDYDVRNNPIPKFAMLTGSTNKICEYSEIWHSYINKVDEKEEDYEVLIGNVTYHLSKDFVRDNHIKKGLLIYGQIHPFAENPISISQSIDLSGTVDTWKAALENEYGKYSASKTEGFFCADKVLLRTTEYVQFEIDGKPTEVMPLGYQISIYEIDENGKTRSVVDAPTNIANNQWFQVKQAVENIAVGDRVWFSIGTTNGCRFINRIYYCKNESLKPKN